MPSVHEALILAEQALEAGDLARSQAICQQILAAVPEEAGALNILGRISHRAGQLTLAEDYLRRAIATFADEPAFHNNLYLVYLQQGRHAEAAECSRAAIRLNANSPQLHNNLGIALKESGALAAAVASFEHSLQLNPSYADAHYNLANTLVLMRHLEAAEREFRRAIELAPHDFEAYNNLGSLQQLRGQYTAASEQFEMALRCRGDSPEVHRNRALLRLLHGDLAGGFAEYEWRWRMPRVLLPNLSKPRWQGESLAGRTLLLWAEQGLGDTIQFVRFAPLVRQPDCRVVLDCAAALHPLLRTAPGIDRLISSATDRDEFDFYLPLLSLPATLGTTVATLPAPPAYLFAETDRAQQWRQRLAGEKQFKVGIAWQGNPNFPGDYYRSVPLEQFAPLARCRDVKLFSLQKNHGRQQLDTWGAPLSIVDLGAGLDENCGAFVETAAAMMNLDLVITSDTAIAHLAGALGVPVWVALQYAPNWRWLLERNDSPWYPSMRLFRQPSFGDWAGVFAQIAAKLSAISSRSKLD